MSYWIVNPYGKQRMNSMLNQREADKLVRTQFIADQQLYHLQLTPLERQTALQYVRPEVLPDQGEDNPEETRASSGRQSKWVRVANRFQFLSNPQFRRLAVTVSAGIGKSLALRQIVVARQNIAGGHVVVPVHFSELPDKPELYLPKPSQINSPPSTLLVDYLVERFETINSRKLQRTLPTDPAVVAHWLVSLIRMGQFSLVVDGLDEVPTSEGVDKAKALHTFLERNPNIGCIVAGRPYAIREHYWPHLFARDVGEGRADQSSDWDFCLVGRFDQNQIQRFIGFDRYLQVQLLQNDAEFTPRILEVIRTLPFEVLNSLRSGADVYWHAISNSVALDRQKKGLKPVTSLKTDEIIDILSAIAISMVMWKHDPTSPNDVALNHQSETNAEPTDQVSQSEFDGKLERLVIKRLQRIYSDWGEEDVRSKLVEIRQLGLSHIDFVRKTTDGGLAWWNPTERDFFAAIWMVRSSSVAEQQWLNTRQSSVLTSRNTTDKSRHSELNEFWRFVCGMPNEAFLDRDLGPDQDGKIWEGETRWLAIVERLFQRPSNHSRSNEMMYRCWPNLLRRAGFLRRADWSEEELQQATTMAQCSIWKQGEDFKGATADVLDRSARRIVDGYLSEYPRLLYSDEGSLSESGKVCWEDGEQFVEIPFPAEGRFICGHKSRSDNLEEERTLWSPFSLNRNQVTNRFYALYDEAHSRRFGAAYTSYSPYPRGPVIYVSWWDAKQFSIWQHGDLIDEWSWEYACRGRYRNPARVEEEMGSQSRYYFRDDDLEDDEARESRLGDYAWNRENSKKLECGLSAGRRELVEGNGWDGKHAHTVGQKLGNEFGINDMLGNVWEWCSNRFREESVSRSCRGGSFNYNAIYASCSYRFHHDPSFAGNSSGFRVSRAVFRKS